MPERTWIEKRASQQTRQVVAAETAVLFRRGGMRAAFWWTGVIGLMVGSLSIAILAYLSSSEPASNSVVEVAIPVEAATSTTILLFSLCLVVYLGRSTQNGLLNTALLMVPNRRRLFEAKVISMTLVAGSLTFGVAMIVGIVSLFRDGSLTWLGEVALGVFCGTVSAALTAVLTLFIVLVVNRPIASLLVQIGLWIIFPLAVMAADGLLPDWSGAVLENISAASPASLLSSATTVSTVPTQGSLTVLHGICGLLVWALLSGTAAFVLFRRRSI